MKMSKRSPVPTTPTVCSRGSLPWLALSLIAASVGSAYAQSATSQDGVGSKAADKATSGEERVTLDTVTVSATRRRELIREVPLSITSVDTQALQSTGAKTLNDYLLAVPGVVLQNSGPIEGTGNIIIRGLTAGIDANSPTSAYVDDVPLSQGSTFDMSLLDLRSFEVLRGPQGTLYGNSSMGGVIKYQTTQPDTGEFTGRVGLSLSQTKHGGTNGMLNAMVNVPLRQDVAALRVAAFGSRDAGYVNATGAAGGKGVNDRDANGVRASLLLSPSSDLDIKLTAMTETRRFDGGGRLTYNPTTRQPTAGDLTYENLGNVEPRQSTRKLYSLNFEYDLKWAKLYSITARQTNEERARTDFTPLGQLYGALGLAPGATGAYIDTTMESTRSTQEFRLVSQTAAELQWLAGFFYDKRRTKPGESDVLQMGASSMVFGGNGGQRDYEEAAFYGNVTWNLSPDFGLTAGLRSAHYKQDDTAFQLGAAPISISFKESPLTYLLAAKYRLSKQSNLYARAASGYRSGGVNYAAKDPVTGGPYPGAKLSYGTDNVWTYEAGYKAVLPEQRAAVEFTVFDTEWKDLQQFTQPGGLGAVGFTTNIGKARITGIEAAATFKPVGQLTLGANLSLLNGKILTDSPGLGAASGDRLPNSPKVAASLTSRYEFSLTGSPAYGGLNLSYQGQRNSSFPNATMVPNFKLDAFTQIDLIGGVKLGAFDLGVFVRNLTDKRGQLGAATGELSSTGRLYVHVIEPRTIGFNLSSAF